MDTENLADGKKEYVQDQDLAGKPEYFVLFARE